MKFRVKDHRFPAVTRGIMRGPRAVSGYGRFGDQNVGTDIMGIIAAASPWNAIISGNTAKEAQANAQLQAVSIGAEQANYRTAANVQIAKYVAMGIAGFAGVVLIASIMKR